MFLKLSEEASCESSVCSATWTYTDTIPTVTSVSAAYDSSENDWVVTVDGTDFTGSTSTTIYAVNGVNQETLSVSSTQAKFKLTNITSQNITGAKLLFDVGKPKSHSLIEASITITPKLTGISPQVGSVNGQVIHVTAPGLTFGDESSIMVVKAGTTTPNLCQNMTIPEQGVLVCELTPGSEFSASSNEYLAIYQSAEYGCETQSDC